MFATLLADELDVGSIVVPPLAGNFSAWGLLGADMVQSAARTRIMPLTDENVALANDILGELQKDLDARGETRTADVVRQARLDLRYVGQEHGPSIAVPVTDDRISASAAEIRALFDEDYLRTFGGTMEFPIEIVSIRATNMVPLPRRQQTLREAGTEPDSVWPAYSFDKGGRVDFRVTHRASITAPISGPAIVIESTATLYVDANWTVSRGQHGELVLSRKES
jgi:N-methylhydantoinase A